MVIDILFLALEEDILTLFFVQEVFKNGLNFSSKGKYVSLCFRRHQLKMDRYSMTESWTADDVSYFF